MRPPYTPEEERKIALVKALMDNGVKAMQDAFDQQIDQAEQELFMAGHTPWSEIKRKSAETEKPEPEPTKTYPDAQGWPTISPPLADPGIPHTDLWGASTDNCTKAVPDAWVPSPPSGSWLKAIEALRADLKRKIDALYGERRSALLVVEDCDARIFRLQKLADDLR
jgi:hypothetical protein